MSDRSSSGGAPAYPMSAAADSHSRHTRIYVGGIPPDATEADIKREFQRYTRHNNTNNTHIAFNQLLVHFHHRTALIDHM